MADLAPRYHWIVPTAHPLSKAAIDDARARGLSARALRVLSRRGPVDGVALADGRELGELLAADPRVSHCIVKQLYRHANARLDAPGEQGVLSELHREFARAGYRFQDLLLELAASQGFRFIAAPEVIP